MSVSAEIAMLSRCSPQRRVLAPNDEWMSTAEVRDALAISDNGRLLADIPHISASMKGKSAKGAGALYSRELINRIIRIKRECNVRNVTAVRIEAALREGRIG